MDKKLIKRRLLEDLKAHLPNQEITLLIGPRQVGKTTLLKLLEADLKTKGEKTLFLNLDIEADRQFFDSQEALIKHIRLSLGENRGYVFIDEAQRKENAGLFFKGIYDMGLPYKFIISGSGSLELKEKIHESMAGRKRIFELPPVSFQEFVSFRTDYQYEDNITTFLQEDALRRNSLLDEYLHFGGYPSVILVASAEEKYHILNEIYQSYLVRDISFLLGVEKTEAFTNLVRLLASQIGNLVATSELATTLGISAQTVKHYLWYLEKTYIVQRINPFFRNPRKELTKMPVYYFYDLGLRNFALQTGIQGAILSQAGFLFENFIFLLLHAHLGNIPSSIHFWRSKGGAEVDFIINHDSTLLPCEVKYISTPSISAGRSLLSFIETYRPQRALIITRDTRATIRIKNATIDVIPFYELLKEDFFKK